MSSVSSLRSPSYSYSGLDEAFPAVDPGLRPFGWRVVVQIRTPKTRSAGGIILTPDVVQTDQDNTQIAKVISVGPGAFRNRDTLQPWAEGEWCIPGAYVRCPKYGGDRWEVEIPGKPEKALFAVFNDMELIGEVTCDPLSVISYI